MATIKVTQVKSPIGRRKDQRETRVGLGLNTLHRTRVLADNAGTRGRIDKVKHLVVFETLDGAEKAEG
jgi:large subunit ribosomal protein L30